MAYTTIPKPSAYFNTNLYTGNDTADTTITGVGFQSDFTWIKSRTTAENHQAYDAVRGGGYRIYPNLANAQSYIATTLTSWTSDGFVVGTDDGVNANGANFVAWNWKANGQGSSNTDGSINTTATSANTTSGFSISTFTATGSAATVGHGLGVVPKLMIVKTVGVTGGWQLYHTSLGATKYMEMDGTGAAATQPTRWNNTEPTSSVFSIGTEWANTNTLVAYCFADVQGYSKMGSYIGTGNVDGAFIYTGFKPAWIMIKQTSASGTNWFLFDSKRLGYNVANYYLSANTTLVDRTAPFLDILSNGFKLRATETDVNGSGATYIYMAFAEEPLVSTNGIPATAR